MANSNLIQVTPEEMVQAAKNVNDNIVGWQSGVSDIYKLTEELDAMWDGMANDSFNNRIAEDRPQYNRLGEMMIEYSQAIKTAANNYIQGDQQVKEIVSRK